MPWRRAGRQWLCLPVAIKKGDNNRSVFFRKKIAGRVTLLPIMATSRHVTQCALCRDVAIIGDRIAQGWGLFEEGWAGEGAMKLGHDGNGDAVSPSLFPLFFRSSIFDRQKKKRGGATGSPTIEGKCCRRRLQPLPLYAAAVVCHRCHTSTTLQLQPSSVAFFVVPSCHHLPPPPANS